MILLSLQATFKYMGMVKVCSLSSISLNYGEIHLRAKANCKANLDEVKTQFQGKPHFWVKCWKKKNDQVKGH